MLVIGFKRSLEAGNEDDFPVSLVLVRHRSPADAPGPAGDSLEREGEPPMSTAKKLALESVLGIRN